MTKIATHTATVKRAHATTVPLLLLLLDESDEDVGAIVGARDVGEMVVPGLSVDGARVPGDGVSTAEVDEDAGTGVGPVALVVAVTSNLVFLCFCVCVWGGLRVQALVFQRFFCSEKCFLKKEFRPVIGIITWQMKRRV